MQTGMAFVIAALASIACASSGAGPQPAVAEPTATQSQVEPKPGPGGGGMMAHDMSSACPIALPGTTARAEDVDGGAALAFTTTGDVAELRRRVARMAEMHDEHHGEGHGAQKGMHAGEMHEMHGGQMHGGMMMPPSTARSEDIEGGARLVFTPRDPTDLAKLREQTRQHAEKMASGHQCPMMHGHGAKGAPSKHGAHHPEG